MKPTARRKLYFSETFGHAVHDGGIARGGARVNFFITVKGQKPVPYDPNNPPAIVTTQGAVEDWTIENQAPEVHEFHMHQIHFMLLAVNGVPVPPEKRQFYDTFQVPLLGPGGPLSEHQGPDGTFAAPSPAISSIIATSSSTRTRA